MISYRFEFTNEFGNIFIMENKNIELYPDVGNNEIDELERAINKFMCQIGYEHCYKKDMIFLESIDEEEYEYLSHCLVDFRDRKESEGVEE